MTNDETRMTNDGSQREPSHLREPSHGTGGAARAASRITVHNIKHGKPAGKREYIGRPRTLGNPFVIGVDGDRATVIAKYKAWLWRCVKEKRGPVYDKLQVLLAGLRRGEDLHLICHCKPLACHGDVVKACLEWMMKNPNPNPARNPNLGDGNGLGVGVGLGAGRSDNDGYAD